MSKIVDSKYIIEKEVREEIASRLEGGIEGLKIMSSSHQVSEYILPVLLYDHIGKLDCSEEGELSGDGGDWRGGDPGVHLRDNVEVRKGESLYLRATGCNGDKVLCFNNGVCRTLHI